MWTVIPGSAIRSEKVGGGVRKPISAHHEERLLCAVKGDVCTQQEEGQSLVRRHLWYIPQNEATAHSKKKMAAHTARRDGCAL